MKPVQEIFVDELDKFLYYAIKVPLAGDALIYGSDSLINLKKKIKELGWQYSMICITKGMMNVGQTITDKVYYNPRY